MRKENSQQVPFLLPDLKCIKQGNTSVYVLRRLNYLYVCWSKSPRNEVDVWISRLDCTV